MELLRFIFRCLLIAIGLGLTLEWFLPGGDRMVDIATALFAAATWVLPLAIIARWHIRPPRTSLGSVGMSISLIASTLTPSLITIVLAILDFIFARGGDWARRSLAAGVAFLLLGAPAPCGGRRVGEPGERGTAQTG